MIWTIEKTGNPWIYILKSADTSNYVKFQIDDVFYGKEIDVSSRNKTEDGAIFIPAAGEYPTEENNYCIIGNALLYNGNEHVKTRLVGAYILESSMENPKTVLEVNFPNNI
jgi:hypothetical protein